MWGIIPAAGKGTRMQPLAFSKELLPVGACDQFGRQRPKAVSEYIIERMIKGGATKLCFVNAPGKGDIIDYYGRRGVEGADLAFVVQPQPLGLCDAIFRARSVIGDRGSVLIGLPDTIWYPEDGFRALDDDVLSFLLFPSAHPEHFDAVVTDDGGRVSVVDVKSTVTRSSWIWGAIKMPSDVFHALDAFWRSRQCIDEYVGTLVSAWIATGGIARGVKAGAHYLDVGTLEGYHSAIEALAPRLTSSEQDRRASHAAR